MDAKRRTRRHYWLVTRFFQQYLLIVISIVLLGFSLFFYLSAEAQLEWIRESAGN